MKREISTPNTWKFSQNSTKFKAITTKYRLCLKRSIQSLKHQINTTKNNKELFHLNRYPKLVHPYPSTSRVRANKDKELVQVSFKRVFKEKDSLHSMTSVIPTSKLFKSLIKKDSKFKIFKREGKTST
jgi:hypothetical protein